MACLSKSITYKDESNKKAFPNLDECTGIALVVGDYRNVFVMTLVLLHFHCIVLYPGFVHVTLLFGFNTADWSTFCFICDIWSRLDEICAVKEGAMKIFLVKLLVFWCETNFHFFEIYFKFVWNEHSSWNQLRKREGKLQVSVPSTVRNCAIPPDNLRSEISFSRICNIANFISYIYSKALVTFVTLETVHFLCVYMVAQLHEH